MVEWKVVSHKETIANNSVVFKHRSHTAFYQSRQEASSSRNNDKIVLLSRAMALLRKTWIVTLCFVVLVEVSRANQDEEETYETQSEARVSRDIKVTFPGSDRIPKPPTALCFREPCNVPGGFRSPARPRFRRSEALEEETYDTQPEARVSRDIKVTFPGSDRIPKPPTALCFREPCNVLGGFRPPARPRFRRSDEALEEETYETQSEVRVPRDIKVTFPGSDRIPKPPIALCFRQPCNVPGGFRPAARPSRFRRSAEEPQEETYETQSEARVPREIKVTFPGSDRIPKPPIALCFRQPCNVPGGFRPAARPSRFRRSAEEPEEETYDPEMESPRVSRDIKVTFPGSDRIPKPPTALCFRQPCNVPGSFRPPPPPRPRFRRSATEEGAYEHEPQRVEREIRRTFTGSDSFTLPPLVLCNREPCNVPERLKNPTSRIL